MGLILLATLITSYSFGYAFKDSGVPIPGIGNVDIWGALVKNNPQTPTEIAFENYTIWILLYSIAHITMYVKPQRSLFHPFKLNPNYPPVSLVLKEIFRSFRGVAICTFYVIMINQFHRTGDLPTNYVPNLFNNDGNAVSECDSSKGFFCICKKTSGKVHNSFMNHERSCSFYSPNCSA